MVSLHMHMAFGRAVGIRSERRPSHDPNAPARWPFLPPRHYEGVPRFGNRSAGFSIPGFRFPDYQFPDFQLWNVPLPQICHSGIAARPYSRAIAPRNSADNGNVNSTNEATSVNAGQTPSASPARPNNIGAIAPEPITPV